MISTRSFGCTVFTLQANLLFTPTVFDATAEGEKPKNRRTFTALQDDTASLTGQGWGGGGE